MDCSVWTFLLYIIEDEIKKAYDDPWLEIVNIKPPWTLVDVLQLLDKHWIAVFGLSYIMEDEVKKAYDDLWSEIVNIKPPWTLVDVLQLLDKHWIAVFGLSYCTSLRTR